MEWSDPRREDRVLGSLVADTRSLNSAQNFFFYTENTYCWWFTWKTQAHSIHLGKKKKSANVEPEEAQCVSCVSSNGEKHGHEAASPAQPPAQLPVLGPGPTPCTLAHKDSSVCPHFATENIKKSQAEI